MPAEEIDTRYSVAADQTAAELIQEMTGGRIGTVYLRLEYGDGGRELVIFERVHVAQGQMDFERRGGEHVSQFPCNAIVAVTRIDPSQPLDRSDELRADQR